MQFRPHLAGMSVTTVPQRAPNLLGKGAKPDTTPSPKESAQTRVSRWDLRAKLPVRCGAGRSAPGSWNSRSKGPRVGLICSYCKPWGQGQTAQAQIAQAWRALGRRLGS